MIVSTKIACLFSGKLRCIYHSSAFYVCCGLKLYALHNVVRCTGNKRSGCAMTQVYRHINVNGWNECSITQLRNLVVMELTIEMEKILLRISCCKDNHIFSGGRHILMDPGLRGSRTGNKVLSI